ncbi:transcription termination factor MTERF15, mitochondrial-like [Rutidosis leptorrhynchoides]|uniref:transcription termination factor MTERF15, mitochondrial-like n=1 Tax=Rutidosis leptorrhynchoides TaxID=125765 RepID=UPI003A99A02F
MFRFACKTLLHIQIQCRSNALLDTNASFIRCLQTVARSDLSSESLERQSLTVSYLVSSCGLSLEKAISASKLMKIKTTERSNAVIDLLTCHGFTKSDITTLVYRFPRVITFDPVKIIKPKIEYFESLGFVGPELPKLVCSNVQILHCSLNKQIIPLFDLLRGYVKTKENLHCALKRFMSIRTGNQVTCNLVSCNLEKVFKPNIKTLITLGVSDEHIGKVIMLEPRLLYSPVDEFVKVADKIIRMGFEPSNMSFLMAVRSMTCLGKGKWEKKKDLLISFGWSEKEFGLAFRKQTMIMLCSEDKIRAMMDCLVNKLDLKPSDVANCPNLFLCSLEKKIMPRYSLIVGLKSRGLKLNNLPLIWILSIEKKRFESMFVTPFIKEAPDLILVYQCQVMEKQGLGKQHHSSLNI